jgi:hypothetical protein
MECGLIRKAWTLPGMANLANPVPRPKQRLFLISVCLTIYVTDENSKDLQTYCQSSQFARTAFNRIFI